MKVKLGVDPLGRIGDGVLDVLLASLLSSLLAGPLVRPNGSLDRHGKVEKSGPDRSFIRKK